VELLGHLSNHKVKDHPLSTVRYFLFNMFARYWRPFVHPQPEDASCYGDRDQIFTVLTIGQMYKLISYHKMCTIL